MEREGVKIKIWNHEVATMKFFDGIDKILISATELHRIRWTIDRVVYLLLNQESECAFKEHCILGSNLKSLLYDNEGICNQRLEYKTRKPESG